MRALKDSFAKMKEEPLLGDYAKYSNDAMGFFLEYPKGWAPSAANELKIAPGSSGNKPDAGRFMIGFVAPKDASGKARHVGINVEMTLYPKDVTINDLDTDFLKLFNWDVHTNKLGTYTYYVPNMSPVTHGTESIGSYAGKRYAFTSENNNYTYAITQVSVPVGKRLYQFQAITDPIYAKDAAAALDHLLKTVTFREPTFTKSVTEKAKSSTSSRPTTNRRNN